MISSDNTFDEPAALDREIDEIKNHPVDCSDIPPAKPGRKVRLVYKEFLDMLPGDIVEELARRRLKELEDYRVTETAT
ncbi:MAG: hypothetical protein LBQ35_06205 [Spirochaetaceae bacterium]|jgi:hypothetical protein|nr:hypothetical protein [Spirochaetaceae bacterium]